MIRPSGSFEIDMRSNQPNEVISDAALKESATALRARVRQKERLGRNDKLPRLSLPDTRWTTPAGAMIYEEIADTFG
jgi:hypothetical protein